MKDLLNNIKLLTNNNNSNNDNLINLHIDNSINAIYTYLNNPNLTNTDILTLYPNAIMQLVIRQLQAQEKGSIGISSITQGSRSISYSSEAQMPYMIDESIKSLLPKPYARVF